MVPLFFVTIPTFVLIEILLAMVLPIAAIASLKGGAMFWA